MSDTRLNGNRKMSAPEGKSPFLIGVAGGTASGKVSAAFAQIGPHLRISRLEHGLQAYYGKIGASRNRQQAETGCLHSPGQFLPRFNSL